MSVIQIKLNSYDQKAIDRSSVSIQHVAAKTGAKIIGPIPMPNKISYCLINSSPHINKRAMDKLEMKKHSRLIKIYNLTTEGFEELKKLDLPAGVHVDIKQ
ncbi:MAG: 30S ribosomal protein S10 [Rickettsiales bacterium]